MLLRFTFLLNFCQSFAKYWISPEILFVVVSHVNFNVYILFLLEAADMFSGLIVFHWPKEV